MVTVCGTCNGLSHDKRFVLLDLYFRNVCTAAGMAVFYGSLMSCFVGMLVTYFLNDFEMAQFAALVTGMSFDFACCVRYIYVVRSWYLKVFRFFLDDILVSFAKLRKRLLTSSCLSLRIEQFGSHWSDFNETDI